VTLRQGPILVTGGAGFAGSHLVEHLASGHQIRQVLAWARSTPANDVERLAEWRRVDILDASQVTAAIREAKPSGIFHLAGLPNVGESWGDTAAPLEVNVMGTHRLLEAVRESGLRCRIVVSGSAHIYGPSVAPIREDHVLAPASPYALSKLAQEQLALRTAAEDGIDVIVARSFNHTGPRQKPSFVAPSIARQIAQIERGGTEPVIRVGNLDAERDLLDVRDVVRAYAALMQSGVPGTVYNVASGIGRPIRAVLDALVARARVPIRIEPDAARMRPNDIRVLVGDATRLRSSTGWQPGIAFDQIMDDLLAYWRTVDLSKQ
jgi:GDP-4-dehydro-6-deoxy-D-mannose reductase